MPVCFTCKETLWPTSPVCFFHTVINVRVSHNLEQEEAKVKVWQKWQIIVPLPETSKWIIMRTSFKQVNAYSYTSRNKTLIQHFLLSYTIERQSFNYITSQYVTVSQPLNLFEGPTWTWTFWNICLPMYGKCKFYDVIISWQSRLSMHWVVLYVWKTA